ncbi:hypothetical protein B5X24_HaOG207094 [Helicoverpa armigera]|uniref:Uncharacterized protein n=1 Tax=Helicoverpa armigera TaxID=29058 RepID=A0A2W1BQ33_HELAM|nr:hypothetical protein B5X24_HaOG207094 [Helicoverpa armigera]
MDQTQANTMCEKKEISTLKSKNGEPVVVINHLNNDRDITNMVDRLLSRSEFSDASSIFVVVPSDDNEADNSSDGRNSTICVQMSANPMKWKRLNSSEYDLSQLRNSSTAHGVRISAKGKKFLMEGLPTTVVSFHNKETMIEYHETIQRVDSIRRQIERTKNKLCQVTTPNEIVETFGNCHVVGTDTTADRPCCCAPKPIEYSDYSCNDTCVANVTSKQVTPLLVDHGLNGDPFRSPGLSMKSHDSIEPLNVSTIPIVAAPVESCNSPLATNKPTEETGKEPNIKPCQCTTEKLTALLQKAVNTSLLLNMKSTGCGGTENLPPPQPHCPVSGQMPPESGKFDDCPTCLHPPEVDFCGCDESKKPVKLKSKCPCPWRHPRSRMTSPAGLIQGELAKVSQGLYSPADPIHQGAQTHQCGAAGESVQTKTGETCTQAGTKQTRFSSSVGTCTDPNNDCPCKRGKKKKKIICKCHESEQESTLESDSLVTPPVETQWVSVDVTDVERVDEREVMKLKSGLTERVSGFKMHQKKRPPAPPPPPPEEEIEYTLDDALRYYAAVNPDLFRTIVEEQQIMIKPQENENKKGRKGKKSKQKVECECPSEVLAPPPPSSATKQAPQQPLGITPIMSQSAPSDGQGEEDEGPFRGLKFKMAGKGSVSPGLAGICCFDLFQESFTTW